MGLFSLQRLIFGELAECFGAFACAGEAGAAAGFLWSLSGSSTSGHVTACSTTDQSRWTRACCTGLSRRKIQTDKTRRRRDELRAGGSGRPGRLTPGRWFHLPRSSPGPHAAPGSAGWFYLSGCCGHVVRCWGQERGWDAVSGAPAGPGRAGQQGRAFPSPSPRGSPCPGDVVPRFRGLCGCC